MQLHDVHIGVHKHKRPKRIGRGVGSGNGKTAGKGHKGHSSRQGYKQNPLMEGGQMPIIRRVPKRGFNNGAFRKDYAIVQHRRPRTLRRRRDHRRGRPACRRHRQGPPRRRRQGPGRRHPDQEAHRPRPQVQRRGGQEDHRRGRPGDRDRLSCPIEERGGTDERDPRRLRHPAESASRRPNCGRCHCEERRRILAEQMAILAEALYRDHPELTDLEALRPRTTSL